MQVCTCVLSFIQNCSDSPDQRLFPTNILHFLFHLHFTNPVREVASIHHAEIVATSDLCLNGKPGLEQSESGGKHTCDLK